MSLKKSHVQKVVEKDALQKERFNAQEGITASDVSINNSLKTPVSSFLEKFFLNQVRFNMEENIKETNSQSSSPSF